MRKPDWQLGHAHRWHNDQAARSSDGANSEEATAQMNAAWQAYADSLETGDTEAILAAAEAAAQAGRTVYGEGDAELPLLLLNYGKVCDRRWIDLRRRFRLYRS